MEDHEKAYSLSLRFGLMDGDGRLPNARHIPIRQITPNPRQPRRNFDPEKMQELVESIREYGILQPLLVHQWDEEKYQLIAGERRFRAAKILGLETVPVIIRDLGAQKELEVALIENLQREDLNPVEAARAFRVLMQEFGLKQQEIGARVGKSQSTISHFLCLLQLPEEILDSLERGDILERHARILLSIEENVERERIYQQILAKRLTAKETANLIKAEREQQKGDPHPTSRGPSSPVEKLRAEVCKPLTEESSERFMGKQLAQKCATRVEIRAHVQGGNILIGFHDKTDLVRIVNILLDVPP
jgi:ParB family transcriptional regulator, chromosome partitioning protein